MINKNSTRKSLSNKIYKTLGFSKNFSSTIVENVINVLVDEIIKSNKVKISSFGTFTVINKKERIGRNPKTKENVMIPSRNVISFIPSKKILEFINIKNEIRKEI